ncbi:RNA deprotection pyrophosphohydrolase [Staphylococcus americanisciuri]|uniref:Nucleoside triphosphatase YtkD n=1 Tax=Staphylococcus americanisciuri TaxID=2973940 RepID=A0ABT2EYK8_9STAP|nr:nucleoside triphosphatase YtkD [Staphylococcus americanisciuri]MCS4485279.1 nucleoside triphosphatase YtkD [Staphylococcus americanisciuri]
MEFIDAANQRVTLKFCAQHDKATGNHVLALPIYRKQLLMTNHCVRGIEFPGGKCEGDESSLDALRRELYEETGATIEAAYYIAQYTVHADPLPFTKDVYAVIVDKIVEKTNYLETNGPVLVSTLEDVPDEQKSTLLLDEAILTCVERISTLGFYQL